MQLPKNLTLEQYNFLMNYQEEFEDLTGRSNIIDYFKEYENFEDLFERVCSDLDLNFNLDR